MSWRDQLPKGSRFKSPWELYLEEWETIDSDNDDDFIDIGNKEFEENLDGVIRNYKVALKEAHKWGLINTQVKDEGLAYADRVEDSID